MASLTREEVHTRLSSVVFAPYVQYLEENQTLIMAIIENQNLGKFPECAQYVSMPGPLSLLQCCASLYMCACVCVCVRERAHSPWLPQCISLSLCVCVCVVPYERQNPTTYHARASHIEFWFLSRFVTLCLRPSWLTQVSGPAATEPHVSCRNRRLAATVRQ